MPLQPSPKASIRQLLTDRETYATTLLVLVLDTYGPEALQWDIATLRHEIADDFGVQLPKLSMDKLTAAILVVTTDEFYWRLSRFISICNVFSGAELNPEVIDPADAEECAWGMTEAMLLSPPDAEEPFSEEIRRYVGKVLDWEGIKTPPDLLKIAVRDTASGMPDYAGMPDDASLFNAFYDAQQTRSQEIEATVRENLHELILQVTSLPIRNGNVDDLSRALEQGTLFA